ncbi:hypothetical protein HDU97_003105 [Phlyctochytrium planicorne]|nr:hypothetical protein HDU97_003057 [Phlyctochytrium planicorne]KAJ3109677.1 hypothetical protein HDU97_003105 [Phlyctochytrium planicorne]
MLSSQSQLSALEKLTANEVKVLNSKDVLDKALKKHNAVLTEQSALPQLSNRNEDKDILVCVRARPLLPHEEAKGLYGAVTTDPAGQNVYLHSMEYNVHMVPKINTRDFNVDKAFAGSTTNEQVYEATAKNLIPLVLGGGVGSLFAYGQTGSGKTFTMTAIEKMIARDLFEAARTYGHNGKSPVSDEPLFEIKACFFELLGSQASDLLTPSAPGSVAILEDVFGRIQVKGAKESVVSNSEELLELIECGATLRRTEGTEKNSTSSRTHAILRIRIKNLRVPEAEDGLMYLLDLAGSESSADTRWHTKERIQESVEINKSLSTLKDCIRNRALSASGGKHVHILDTSQSLSTLRYIAPLKVNVPKANTKIDPDDPRHWSNEQLRAWVVAAQVPTVSPKQPPPKVTKAEAPTAIISPDVLCPFESGKQILNLPEAIFIQRCVECGVTPKEAKKFYIKLWKLLIDARTKTRTEKMTELKKRVKSNSEHRDQIFSEMMINSVKR